MWTDLEAALGTRDMLIEAAFILTANAHMIRFPDESLSFVQRLLNIAEHEFHRRAGGEAVVVIHGTATPRAIDYENSIRLGCGCKTCVEHRRASR